MKKRLLTFIFISAAVLVGGCAPDSNNAGSKAVSTDKKPVNPQPKIIKEDGFKITRGSTQAQDMNIIYDSETKGMKLQGKIEYVTVNGDQRRIINVDLAGVMDKEGSIPLKSAGQNTAKNGEMLVAKATCLSEEGCEKSFIDIYLYIDGVVYHHQIESQQDSKPDAGDPESTTETDPNSSDAEEEFDEIEESGRYIGTVKKDIETLLNLKPEKVEEKEASPEENFEEEPEGSENPPPQEESDISEEDDADKNGNDSSKKEESANNAAPKDSKNLEPPKKVEGPKKADPPKKQATPKKEGSPKKEEPPKKEVPPPKKSADTKKDAPQKVEPSKKEEAPKKEEPKENAPKKTDPLQVSKEKEKKNSNSKDESKKGAVNSELPKDKVEHPIQAIGKVNTGHLINATNIYAYEKKYRPTGFQILYPQRKSYYGTNEMLYVLRLLGNYTKENVPDQPLFVNDISYKNGGKIGQHKSHKIGQDADIAYFFNNKTFRGYFASAVAVNKPHPNWMIEEQWKLLKFLVSTKYVDRIFMHQVLKKALCKLAIERGEIRKEDRKGLVYETLRRLRLDPKSHHDHFHLRIKCSKAQKSCFVYDDPPPGSGCF